MSKRAAPPAIAWMRLSARFAALAGRTDLPVWTMERDLGILEMRAAKQYATCLEHEMVPSELQPSKDGHLLRGNIETDERERGYEINSMGDLLALEPESRPSPQVRFEAHGKAEIAWCVCVFERMPERYPHSFDGYDPRLPIDPVPRRLSDRARLRWFKRRASMQSDACAMLADLCKSLQGNPEDADYYKPANYFDPKVADRLRHAASSGRKEKPVRSKTVAGTKLYHVGDARRWWPNDVPVA